MTLLEEIQAKCSPELIAAGDVAAVTATVNTGRMRVVSYEGGVGSIMRALGAEAGAQFLDTLELLAQSDASIKWAMRLILAGSLDFGDAIVRAQIDQLAPGPAAAALKALAEVPDPVTRGEVAHALGLTGWSAELISSVATNDGLVSATVRFTKATDPGATFDRVFQAQDMSEAHLRSLVADTIVGLYIRDTAREGLAGVAGL